MKKTRLAVSTIALTLGLSFSALAGQWKQDSTGWWYRNDDGSYPIGWFLDGADNSLYYFDDFGYMKTNSWIASNGKLYYVGSDGRMLTNMITSDGIYVDRSGAASEIQDMEEYENVVNDSMTIEKNGQSIIIPCTIHYNDKRVGTHTTVRYDSVGIQYFNDIPKLVVTHTVLKKGGYSATYMHLDMYINGFKIGDLGENNAIEIRFNKDYTVIDIPHYSFNNGDVVDFYITF